MPKTCTHPSCTYIVWGKGYCKNHQGLRTDKKPKAPKPRKPIKAKKPKRIKPRTKKRAEQYALYRIQREEFFSKFENQMCAVYPHLPACDVHHMKGKIGDLLNDVRWWLPVSRDGHDWIENHPELAKERGFSVSRLCCMTDELNSNV